MMARVSGRTRGMLLGALVLFLAGGSTLTPRALRSADAFRVQRVEVVGTRFTEPYDVVRAAGLEGRASVFDDQDAWRAGVLTLPLVDDVQVQRKLPGTVTITVAEVEPVAMVSGARLRTVDATGWLLPLDPAGLSLDLPILGGVTAKAGRLNGDDGGAQALAALMMLRREAPELADRVSQIERQGKMLRVAFRDEGAEALLPLDATELEVRQLRLAFADLTARGELSSVRRIDLRFRDQVVVSFLSRPVS